PASRLAVHMHLPLQRRQRREIVRARSKIDPRQSIPAAQLARGADAQCAPTIVDHSLRHRLEQKPTHCCKSEGCREHQWNDSRTHEASDTTTSRDERKSTIRRRNESLREANPLGLI